MDRKQKVTGFLVGLALSSLLGVVTAQAQEIVELEKGHYSTKDLNAVTAIGAQKTFFIRSASGLSGKLQIQTDKGKNVTVTYKRQSHAQDRDKGIDFIDLISVSLTTTADQAKLEMRAPNPAPWKQADEAGMVEAVVTIPEDCLLDIDASSFDVSAIGPFKSFVVHSSLGRLDVSDVTGKLDLTTSNRRINIEKITGDISVATTNEAIIGRDISSPTGQAILRNDGGDIKIDRLTGGVNIKNSYGRIDISSFIPTGSTNFIRNNTGPIILEIAHMGPGQLVVSNQYDGIELTVPDTLSAQLSLKVDEDGVIEAKNFPFRTDLVEHNRLNLRSGTGLAELSCSVRGKGNISVRGVRGE
ncbi:MAG: hypothetical protein WAU88_11060 [Candidatus Zixiibacteriota bacterium]